MIRVEDGASEIFSPAIDQYETHFGVTFPLYEHLDGLGGYGYTITVDGAKKLRDMLRKAVNNDEPFPVPKDYDDRIY